MRKRSRLILTGLAATILLALAVNTATAGHFRVTEKNFEIIWNAALGGGKTNLSFSDNGGHTLTCAKTLLGSFTESTIAKRAGSKIGQINHATIGSCTEGRVTVLQETLPWDIRYSSFSGTLPNRISGVTVNLIRASFRVEVVGVNCLVATELSEPFVGIIENFEASGAPENLRAEERATIALGGAFLCNFTSPGHVSGIALVRNLPATAKVTLTLI